MANLSNINNKFLVTTGGNVGINTTSPGVKLDVNGATYVRNVIYGYAGGGNQYGGLSWGGTDEGFLFLKDSNVTKVNINSNGNSYLNGGNVGIGTAAPDSPLEIEFAENTGTIKQMLHLDYNPVNNYGSALFKISAGTNSAAVTQIEQVTSGGNGSFGTYQDTNIINRGVGGISAGNINFITGSNTSASSIVMTIGGGSQKGNVGIGTATPENKLHILRSSSDTQSQLMVQNGSTGDAAIKFNVSGQSYVMGIDYDDSKKFKIASSSNLGTTDRITLLSSGNVGIGTISPGAKLDVVGDVRTSTRYLIVTGTANETAAIGYWDGVNFRVESGAAKPMLITSYQGNIKLGISGGTTMTIQSSNVGIGTTNPSSKLTVYGGGTTSSTLELRGAANGGDNATISTQQSMVFQIGSAGATGRSFTFSKNGLGYSDGTALFSIDANGGTFNRLWPQTGTSGSSSVVQTTLIPEPGIYEYYLQGNPNVGGSGAYRSLQAGLITIAVDYTQAKSVFLRIKRTVTAQDGGGSSNIQLNLNVYMLYNGSASDEQSIANKDASVIYLTVSGYMGTVGSGQILRLTRKV